MIIFYPAIFVEYHQQKRKIFLGKFVNIPSYG